MAYLIMTGQTFDSLSDLGQQKGTEGVVVTVAYATTAGDRGGGAYRWSDSAVNTPDGVNYVQVGSNSGRWMRLANNNYVNSNINFNVASILTTSYTLAHGFNFTPSGIQLQATTDVAASGVVWYSNLNSSTVTINFRTLALTGTANFFCTAIR